MCSIIKLLQTAVTLLSFFTMATLGCVSWAQQDRLPAPGVMVRLSPPCNPPVFKGVKIDAANPFRFDFILDEGDRPFAKDLSSQEQLKAEATKLLKYFLASLTVPEKDLWVNLSPYEKDRIIPRSFGLTEMGRDLLAEDYILKQITASLIYPEDETGKTFWKRTYEEATKKFGTTNVPVNTFNKVWILPEKAVVYENAKAGAAYVVEAKLKVMLEGDYLSLQKHVGINVSLTAKESNRLGSKIVREVVIPELTREVNENKNFSRLRQVYSSLILAAWYKKKIKDSILNQVYADKNKVAGVGFVNSLSIESIYRRYLQAFKKGVYNYIKEDEDPITHESIPRKYFSGGLDLVMSPNMETVDERDTIRGKIRMRDGREIEVSNGMMVHGMIVQGELRISGGQKPVDMEVLHLPGKAGVPQGPSRMLDDRLNGNSAMVSSGKRLLIGGFATSPKSRKVSKKSILEALSQLEESKRDEILKALRERGIVEEASIEQVAVKNELNEEEVGGIVRKNGGNEMDVKKMWTVLYKPNQDAVLVDAKRGLLAVFDGVGGRPAGDVASGIAKKLTDERLSQEKISEFKSRPDIENYLKEMVKFINQAILDHAKKHSETEGMETTLNLNLIWEDPGTKKILLFIVSVGNSRSYIQRGHEGYSIDQATRDDTTARDLVELYVKQGKISSEEAEEAAKQLPLLRDLSDALGAEDRESQVPEILKDHQLQVRELGPKDTVFSMTDGAWGPVDIKELLEAMGKRGEFHPTELAEGLVAEAQKKGAKDDMTVGILSQWELADKAMLPPRRPTALAPAALNSNTGGIDLTAGNLNLRTENKGGAIVFRLDPATLARLRNVQGFAPVIVKIQPMTDLKAFLGINTA